MKGYKKPASYAVRPANLTVNLLIALAQAIIGSFFSNYHVVGMAFP